MAVSTRRAPQDQAGNRAGKPAGTRAGRHESRHQSKHELEYVVLHGKRRAYLKAGQGPALLLLHGLGCDHTTWLPVFDELAKRYTVIAPDFLGHGASDKPRADYSVAGYANGMRDLLTVLGIDKATVVGHSFGGGVALQFGYQFPERTQRIMVVATGGFGPEVTPFIKLIQAPGWSAAMGVLTLPGIRHVELAAMRIAAQVPGPLRRYLRDLDEVATIVDSWKDRHARFAIRHLVRSVIDWRGQVVTIADRAYLTEVMPVAVVWGRDDQVIPVRHANVAASLAPQARVEVIPDSGHFPHKDHPEQFMAILNDFVAGTEPATYNRARFRRMLKAGRADLPAPLSSVGDATGAPA